MGATTFGEPGADPAVDARAGVEPEQSTGTGVGEGSDETAAGGVDVGVGDGRDEAVGEGADVGAAVGSGEAVGESVDVGATDRSGEAVGDGTDVGRRTVGRCRLKGRGCYYGCKRRGFNSRRYGRLKVGGGRVGERFLCCGRLCSRTVRARPNQQ